jgi:hypothetical protein
MTSGILFKEVSSRTRNTGCTSCNGTSTFWTHLSINNELNKIAIN